MRVREDFFELIEEAGLGGVDDLSGIGQGEPAGPVDLGEGQLAAGAAGPFHFDHIAGDGGGVQVAGGGPGVDSFSAFLPDGAKGGEGAFEGRAGLFPEFTDGGVEGGFFIFELAFGDRPGAGVLFLPKGAAGVGEEDFEHAGGAPVEEDAGRLFGGHG